MRAEKPFFPLIIIGFLISVMTNPLAHAHVELIYSEPASESTITSMPSIIKLTFGEELVTIGEEQINTIELLDPLGKSIVLENVSVEGANLSAAIKISTVQGFSDGEYKIQYRAVSADGHAILGSTSFQIQTAARATETDQSTSTTSTSDSPKAEHRSFGGDLPVIVGSILLFLLIGSVLIIRMK